MAEWANPYSNPPNNNGKPSQNMVGGYYNIKKGLNLEWDAQEAHIGVMVKCQQTFGHIV